MSKKGKNITDSAVSHDGELERKIIENLIALQKVHADLAEKFDKLAKEISSLLSLFESTARSFAEHPAIQATEKDKEFLDKIDKLLEQNKLIAKGLTLMEERMRQRVYGTRVNMPEIRQEEKDELKTAGSVSRPLPKF